MSPSTRSLYTVFLTLALATVSCSTQNPSLVPPTVSEAPSTSTPPPAAETDTSEPTTTLEATSTSAAPITLPDPASYQWAEVISGLQSPIAIANAADGSGRLFVVEQAGVIRIVADGKLATQPFLNIKDRVGANSSERGLLGLAFHPKYKENGYFYVNYTKPDGNSVVSRFQATGNTADPASEKKLLSVAQPFPNHNGGSVAFGPDGYLYLGFGDGGSGGDPYGNGQSTSTLLGKILRIDVDGGDPYAIPQDNPFANGGGEPEIWAYGLRNPWRFSFDPATHDFYIGDVGQGDWEEIDFLPAGAAGGANFGWNVMEGTHPFSGSDSEAFVAPVAEYSHSEGGCSVTGGYVYHGAALPAWNGIYFYGDYCSGKIWGLHKAAASWQSTQLFQTGQQITTFGVDESGEIYFAGYNGQIFRLEKK
jgi:glucose/arabinose dehydrogenase